MKIFCWNMDYWKNAGKKFHEASEWKNKCINFLKKEEDVDFYIFQEVNPLKLFEKTPNQYEFLMTEYNILYHELTPELLFDGRKDNFWGNAIFYHNRYKLEKNDIDILDISKYYYGRNGIMCYEFISRNKENVIIINFYNKKNYANYGSYTKMLDDFDNDREIINILKKANARVIMAGDFNTGFRINDKEKYNKFIEAYNCKYNLINCFRNYSEEFIPTSYHISSKKYYLNDFCFSKNFKDIKIINEKDEWENINNKMFWKGLSDHRPLIIEVN